MYEFLKENKNLGKNIILLGAGGSKAYGTNLPTSDTDLRGIAIETRETLLTTEKFEQFEHRESDTVIYSLKKAISLLINCNPNMIEMLGFREYIRLSEEGKLLLENRKLFLSKAAENSFFGYAKQQFTRLENLVGKRATYAESHGRMAKHMMHLLRLYMTAIDIFEKEEIVTYREKEHDVLMAIREGRFLRNNKPINLFYQLVEMYETKLRAAIEKSKLPERADREKINNLMMDLYNIRVFKER